MSGLTDEICALIDKTSEEEKIVILEYLRRNIPLHPLEQKWATTAEAILTAIARSSDLTLRGVRGILAEATFERSTLPPLIAEGWKAAQILGDRAYDFLLEREKISVRIQVKLQRSEKGVPKKYAAAKVTALISALERMYVVEVQKTRSGQRKGEETRPYRFGDFDILAVNLHPITGDWKRFVYTVGDWLLPRAANPELIEILQPVPDRPDRYWTDDLVVCIKWFLEGRKGRIYSEA
jgi:hypothetical protein